MIGPAKLTGRPGYTGSGSHTEWPRERSPSRLSGRQLGRQGGHPVWAPKRAICMPAHASAAGGPTPGSAD